MKLKKQSLNDYNTWQVTSAMHMMSPLTIKKNLIGINDTTVQRRFMKNQAYHEDIHL